MFGCGHESQVSTATSGIGAGGARTYPCPYLMTLPFYPVLVTSQPRASGCPFLGSSQGSPSPPRWRPRYGPCPRGISCLNSHPPWRQVRSSARRQDSLSESGIWMTTCQRITIPARAAAELVMHHLMHHWGNRIRNSLRTLRDNGLANRNFPGNRNCVYPASMICCFVIPFEPL